MGKGFLDEKVVDLKNGSRTAIATLRLYDNGWVVHTIEESGYPDILDRESTFPDFEQAKLAARTMWLP